MRRAQPRCAGEEEADAIGGRGEWCRDQPRQRGRASVPPVPGRAHVPAASVCRRRGLVRVCVRDRLAKASTAGRRHRGEPPRGTTCACLRWTWT